jgi:hypothetical protein
MDKRVKPLLRMVINYGLWLSAIHPGLACQWLYHTTNAEPNTWSGGSDGAALELIAWAMGG